MVNKIFLGKRALEADVYVDSMNYRAARENELKDIALNFAEKVKQTGKEYSLNPMNPYERRLVHMALKDDDGIATISRGDGYIKRVSIVAKK